MIDHDAAALLLVVDDEASLRDLMIEFLTRQGHQVRAAADGPQALRIVEEASPQVILLDLNMPDMNGVEVMRRLSAQGFRGRIVVITGSQDESLLREALDIGAVDVLNKPVEPERLRLAVDIGLAVTEVVPSQKSTQSVAGKSNARRDAPATVLVVEDEAALGQLIQETLEREGYHVLVALDGDVALRLLRERGTSINVLLTDVMLPRINGLDLITLVEGQWPHINIVLSSGKLSEAELAYASTSYLAKPFTMDQLRQVLGRLIPKPSHPQGLPQRSFTAPLAVEAALDEAHIRRTRAMTSSPVGSTPKKSPSILVIDDDPEVATLLRDFLVRQGYGVRFAATGREAFALLQKSKPDVLLIDLAMPSMNGVELLRALRAKYDNRLPFTVIVLTGSGGEPIFDQAHALGISDILHKPFDPIELNRLITQRLHEASGA